ncbi:right-handed parallel beta-helix repeat-containing protein [Sphingorhabdus sp.]|uniref:right-handed parallel beta-helix repeat-containing protein n=1 Tax=Sphingorhabdus sp. TaxID=1902408 RepID=UPI0035ADE411|nr:right-handed parallel beta-helix repeat-containing protein [Sphingomonadaceae bacterium]
MKRIPILLIPAIAVIASMSATAQQGVAPFQVAETGRSYSRLADAVDAIGDRQGTILIAPGSYSECAVQSAGHIAFKAEVPGRSIFDGGVCEGKAALVLRGQSAAIDGLVFQNMAVPDGNGAGIRLEKGNLAVTRSVFRNSEQGILTAQDPGGEIVIDQTTFSELGRCDRGLSCAHSIYIGDFASLTVTRSRFERGNGGHYVKSRAARAIIQNNAFDDTRGQATNYMIDLPGGATGMISGNVFVQGQDKENYSAFIAVAAEGRVRSSAGLAISGNDASLATGVDRNTVFLADWSGDSIVLGANRLGRGLKPFEKR